MKTTMKTETTGRQTPEMVLPYRAYTDANGYEFVMNGNGDVVCQPRKKGVAKNIVRAVNSHESLVKAAKCLAILGISTCDRCDGSGKEPRDDTSACNMCGGCGEVCSPADPQDVKDARSALQLATQGTQREKGVAE